MVGDRRGRLHRGARGAGVPGRGHRRRRAGRPLQRPTATSCRDGRPVRRGQRSSTRDGWSGRDRRAPRSSGVVHLAGFKYAGVSVERPLHTYDQNVDRDGLAAAGHGGRQAVDRIVFSSSAATFGTPDDRVRHRGEPPSTRESPYGESKLIGEWLLRGPGTATGLRHTSLRYFNVVGSAPDDGLRHQSAQPVPARDRGAALGKHAADQRRRLPTPGRHLRARLHPRRRPGDVARRGGAAPWTTGRALEARATTWAAARASRSARSWRRWRGARAIDFAPEIHPRRPGDPDRIVASATWRPATWTGRCGTPSTRWSPPPGRPAAHTSTEGPCMSTAEQPATWPTSSASTAGSPSSPARPRASASPSPRRWPRPAPTSSLGARRADRLEETKALVEATGRRAVAVAHRRRRRPRTARRWSTPRWPSSGASTSWSTTPASAPPCPPPARRPSSSAQVIDVNLNGCYWMAQACGRVMQPGSSIINISSRARPHHRRGCRRRRTPRRRPASSASPATWRSSGPGARASASTRSPRASSSPR